MKFFSHFLRKKKIHQEIYQDFFCALKKNQKKNNNKSFKEKKRMNFPKKDIKTIIKNTGLEQIVEEWKPHTSNATKCLEFFKKSSKCIFCIYDNCCITPDKKNWAADFPIENMGVIIDWISNSVAQDPKSRQQLTNHFARELSQYHSKFLLSQAQIKKGADFPIDAVMSCLSVADSKETVDQDIDIAGESNEEEEEQEEDSRDDEEEDEGDEGDEDEDDNMSHEEAEGKSSK